jgi:prophage DNA circulation protein
MGIYDDVLYKPSYLGVTFKYTTGTNTAGRKVVVHEFPNKTFRYIEDLGNNLRTFSITGLVDGEDGNDWLANKAALEKALTTEGIGLLVHPFYGNVNCVCTGYTVTDDDKEIGTTIFEMNFAEANLNIFPTIISKFASFVANLAVEMYDKIGSFVKKLSIRFFRNIQDAGNHLKILVQRLRGISNVSGATSDSKASFNVLLNSFEKDAYTLPQNPEELGNRLPELINSFNDLAQTTDDRDNINNKLFGFGEDITSSTLSPSSFGLADGLFASNNTKSAEDIEKQRNRQIINGSINGLALANLYENAVLIEYQDDQELNSKIIDLENKYERLAFGSNNALDDESSNTMQSLRDEWRKFYENLRLTINKVIEIETKRTPLKVLVYQYYGNIDEFDTIMQLNNINNPALIEGKINVLSQ